MLIWDLEGSTKFQAIVPTYLQGAMGAVIVADISRQETRDMTFPVIFLQEKFDALKTL